MGGHGEHMCSVAERGKQALHYVQRLIHTHTPLILIACTVRGEATFAQFIGEGLLLHILLTCSYTHIFIHTYTHTHT
jgi:hypothetical protein